MNPTIKLIQIIGSPFASPLSELALNNSQVSELYTLALKNKIGLYFLETLKRHQELGDLQSEYDKGYFRYSETVVTAARISNVLDNAGVDHVIFKFVKPYPATPSDVDVLFLCSNDEYKKALEMLFNNGYFRLGAAPHQVVAYDLRGGYASMDTRLKGGKEGGIYYIDLYDEIAASHVLYMDKEKLRGYTSEIELNKLKFKTLKPEADLAVAIAHSVIPEQLYTLADYYTILFCLANMCEADMTNFVSIIREDNLTLAAKSSIKIAALLHQAAHGFIPQIVQKALDELGIRNLRKDGIQANFQAPHRFSALTVVGALGEKLQAGKFIKSVVRQVIAMLNPRFGKRVIDGLIERRRRETY